MTLKNSSSSSSRGSRLSVRGDERTRGGRAQFQKQLKEARAEVRRRERAISWATRASVQRQRALLSTRRQGEGIGHDGVGSVIGKDDDDDPRERLHSAAGNATTNSTIVEVGDLDPLTGRQVVHKVHV